ncbi:MAG: LPS export ABC transporter periplasmic protein LptC [Kiritimatiellae bacterium]|nr:LPS export ABC transporter periplasmic protein LptC [Kiritimatiellia bacterium]
MRLLVNRYWLVYLLGVFVIALFTTVFAQTNMDSAGISGTVTGLRLPLGYYDNGQLKSQLKAEKATMQENGPIYAVNITSEFFTVEGQLDIVMISENCTYDKMAKTAKSDDSNVRLEKKGLTITGKGLDWNMNEQVVTVVSNVNVVMTRSMMNVNIKNMLKGKKK